MKNTTLREMFFGMARDNSHAAVMSHKDNPLSPVGHWKWQQERIQWGDVQKGLPDGAALAFINALRREPPDEGWIIVYGRDTIEEDLQVQADAEE